ncbi:MAG: hypothetical protein LBU92_03020 [Prevotellaceae bacterium]|jgi:hypothetical protein|nr:hypothetical protein [Prevotellaceae bacterium]
MASNQSTAKQKILLTLGIFIFAMYMALGLAFVFVTELPFNMSPTMRVSFGAVLIAYAGFRLYRLVKQSKNQ